MKKAFAFALTLTLIVAACSPSGGTFRLKGRFKNFNQGELYVYTLTGKAKIDTVKLMEGRFTYEVPIEDTIVMSMVFPNYSEIPFVAIPGATVKMEGDASHLREVSVKGTPENDELTQFRLQVSDKTPPEATKDAEQFIKDHPASPACLFVLNKYFLLRADADYKHVAGLLKRMQQAAPANRKLAALYKQVTTMRNTRKDERLPQFKTATINGQTATNASLKGELNIVSLWAAWNFESQTMQRQLRRMKTKYGKRLQLMSVSIDGNVEECRRQAERDSLTWPVVCDGKMWSTPLVNQLGLFTIPSVIMTDANGRIIARQLTSKELKDEIEKRLK